MAGSLGRAPGECQAPGRSCIQVGPRSARAGRRWAAQDDGTQSQGTPWRRRRVGSPEALEGAEETPAADGGRRERGSGMRTVQKECGQQTGLWVLARDSRCSQVRAWGPREGHGR